MNIFITGGSGFIGYHIVKKFLLNPVNKAVIVFDNFSSGTKNYLDDYLGNKKLTIIEGDIKNLDLLKSSMKNVDLVVHLAANPDISKAITDPSIDFWEGTYLTQNVVEAMRVNGVKNILYTSGSGVYGEHFDVKFHENFGPCFPISTYGASKLACESLICSYCYMFGMKARVFRFANVVGPKQTHGVGYDFVKRLKKNQSELRILGDGSQSKSYVYVDDILDAIFLVLEELNQKNSKFFDTYNVATDDYITVTEIANIALEVFNFSQNQVSFNYSGGDRGWKGDVPKVLLDINKIKKLGWKANKNSHQAIKSSISSMKKELDNLNDK